jgi:hypothetical protein
MRNIIQTAFGCVRVKMTRACPANLFSIRKQVDFRLKEKTANPDQYRKLLQTCLLNLSPIHFHRHPGYFRKPEEKRDFCQLIAEWITQSSI